MDADEWNTVAMLQALTVYILLRVFTQDTVSMDLDIALVQTMTVCHCYLFWPCVFNQILQKIAIKCEESGFICSSEYARESPSWSSWILVESKRRFVVPLLIPLGSVGINSNRIQNRHTPLYHPSPLRHQSRSTAQGPVWSLPITSTSVQRCLGRSERIWMEETTRSLAARYKRARADLRWHAWHSGKHAPGAGFARAGCA